MAEEVDEAGRHRHKANANFGILANPSPVQQHPAGICTQPSDVVGSTLIALAGLIANISCAPGALVTKEQGEARCTVFNLRTESL
ncbi:hypothetical protein pipiens_015474 [Culex pipiens pipiens]|uniref:Uncharacterized protein n=1 Tax=Culex pipiens pipiens TaxID=38569 RepID=A0ABD1CQB7_CULPP